MNIFIITSTWKYNKNIRVMLSRKRRTLHLTDFAYICCFIVDKTRSHNTKNMSQFLFLFSFSFVCLFCFSFVNIFKVTLVVISFCYLSVISENTYPISLKIKWQISRIPIYPNQGSVVGGYSTYFVTKDTKSLSKYKTTIFTRC